MPKKREATPPGLVHEQFDDYAQQRDAAEMGMWIFLSTEVMLFGGMFLAYWIYRTHYEAAFEHASQHNDVFLGTINTAVLLTSSFTAALAVNMAAEGKRKGLIASLAATIVLGLAFLAIKFYEYYVHYQEGLMPLFGLPFGYQGADKPEAQMFFNFYYLTTGVHALHMLVGILLLGTLLALALRGRLLGLRSTPVHVSALYWHFVDIVWIFLYPFMYLVGVRG